MSKRNRTGKVAMPQTPPALVRYNQNSGTSRAGSRPNARLYQTAPSLKTARKNDIKVRGQLELSFLRNKPNIFTVHKA